MDRMEDAMHISSDFTCLCPEFTNKGLSRTQRDLCASLNSRPCILAAPSGMYREAWRLCAVRDKESRAWTRHSGCRCLYVPRMVAVHAKIGLI
jgi:hypothetical protein